MRAAYIQPSMPRRDLTKKLPGFLGRFADDGAAISVKVKGAESAI
jgi:hypothetical protein